MVLKIPWLTWAPFWLNACRFESLFEYISNVFIEKSINSAQPQTPPLGANANLLLEVYFNLAGSMNQRKKDAKSSIHRSHGADESVGVAMFDDHAFLFRM